MKITWEGAFYQSEKVKINSSWVFYFKNVGANASELFYVAYLADNKEFLIPFQILHSCKLASLNWWKSSQVWENVFFGKLVSIFKSIHTHFKRVRFADSKLKCTVIYWNVMHFTWNSNKIFYNFRSNGIFLSCDFF